MRPHPRRAGRAAAASWVFTAALFVGGFCGLKVLEGTPRGWLVPQGERVDPGEEDARTRYWAGGRVLEDGRRLEVEVLPLHAGCDSDGTCDYGVFRARKLVDKLGIEREGELLRLVLSLAKPPQVIGAAGATGATGASGAADQEPPLEAGPLALSGARLSNTEGVELAVSLGSIVAHDGAGAPLVQLFVEPPRALSEGETKPWMFWGRLEGEGLFLEVELEGYAEPFRIPLESIEVPVEGLPRWFARTAEEVAAAGGDDPRDLEIARLKRELAAEKDRRLERELAWFEFNRTLATMEWNAPVFPQEAKYAPLASGNPEPGEEVEEEVEEESPEDLEHRRRQERAREIGIALNALMRIEGLRSLDLLEPGVLLEGAIGPVVFRTLDHRGRLTGSMSAQRLRLEASRAARTLTIVLEQGSESIAGETTPFAGGVRRVVLPHVDPEDWLDKAPELFADRSSESGEDDGRWHLPSLRLELNRLLALDAAGGFFRVHALGGCFGENLIELHLEEFDARGRIQRRFFADRARVRLGEEGVLLELYDGAIVRGDEKLGFRDGVHRIYLPRASRSEWRKAKIPGLSQPPDEGGQPLADEEEAPSAAEPEGEQGAPVERTPAADEPTREEPDRDSNGNAGEG